MQTFTGYFGVQGAGKSYEIVKNIILPTLVKTNRRIVVNIDGINIDAISDYLGLDCTDRIVLYNDEDLVAVGFIPTAAEVDSAESKSIVQPGDLLIIDEAARYLGNSKKPPEHIIDFVRMARHYTDESGMPCNILVAAQALSMIHKDLREMLATVTKFRKHIAVGQPNRYVVHVYDGNKPVRDALCNTYQEGYDPSIFPLYKSHSGGAGLEVMVDDRVNMLKGRGFKWLRYGMIISGVIALGAAFWTYTWFKHITAPKPIAGSLADSGRPYAPPGPQADTAGKDSVGTHLPSLTKSTRPRRILGSVFGPDGNEFLLLDTPDGVMLKPSLNAIHTGIGIFYEFEGNKYSSLAPVEHASHSAGLL